ncbi:conserved hypothetical protein [Cenarchaeum symbiosum A]|uniref:NAD(P)H-hydrate epimerase n=1 Tax=Cenarchaeum symbiosum (strain A) TaxID=414004 RepID=NNRE_CENSY|nr:RecName: Full=NAD(P)H-hydrate epimerase; AltName: Full=NAD(P)HX epimerase [Cenarchaeum symbiosum A]ABK78223.1 conserved hypothetical protein [Cenarchaeum symbiosum A]
MDISVKQMYNIEENGHAMGFLKKFMMENAGAAAARLLDERLEGAPRVLAFAGMGNNGGDALVAARHLAGRGADVTVVLLGNPDGIRTEEARWNWSILEKMPSIKLVSGGSFDASVSPDAIIDGILGTGITGEIREPYLSAIKFINGIQCTKMAIDAPSGLDPQTGEAADPCVKVDFTVTFHRMKEGIPKRKDLTGDVTVQKIGIPPEAEKGVL